MPQVFPRSANTLARVSLAAVPLTLGLVIWACLVYTRSSWGTDAGVVREQPVVFSHEHHAGQLGIDCRYCHISVEHAPNAGMPTTEICMNCHSQMWVGGSMLEPVRASLRTNKSLVWQRVYNTPGFAYFDHSIHVNKGVGCSTCHGRVDRMPLMHQVPSLLMEWCLDCHRRPERNLRPRAEIFDMAWQPGPEQAEAGRQLAAQYRIRDANFLTSCTVCHR